MKKAWNKKQRGMKAKVREYRTFGLIVLAIAVLVLGTIAVVATSTHPNLAYKTFPQSEPSSGVITLDWPRLYQLQEMRRKSEHVPQEFLVSTVRLPGYLLPVEEAVGSGESAEFVLVPDPGNWLHPAHTDDGVLVRVQRKTKTPLSRERAVWVQGRLTLSTDERSHIEASEVYEAAKI